MEKETDLTAAIILEELKQCSNPEKQKILSRFFKTGKGEYGEGDLFLGITVPFIRKIAKQHSKEHISLTTIHTLLYSKWHDCRLCALFLLIERFKESDAAEQKSICEFYLQHTDRINNWDLVDLSAPYILGVYLLNHSREILYQLADSSSLWEQRIAIVSTWTLIRNNEFEDCTALSERLLHHKHDLIHKAVGWMLREMGKRNKELLVDFLRQHGSEMPRTMLRYAIEKLPEEERLYYLNSTRKQKQNSI